MTNEETFIAFKTSQRLTCIIVSKINKKKTNKLGGKKYTNMKKEGK